MNFNTIHCYQVTGIEKALKSPLLNVFLAPFFLDCLSHLLSMLKGNLVNSERTVPLNKYTREGQSIIIRLLNDLYSL